MKGGKYTKTFAKIQARRIFCIRDIGRNVLPKFYMETCMEMPCWLGINMADGNREKRLLPSFGTKARIYSSRNS